MNVFQKAWKRLLEAGSFYRYLLVGVGTSLLDFSLFSLLSVGFVLFFCGVDSFYGDGPSICHHLGDCPWSSRTRCRGLAILAETCRKDRCNGYRSGV